MRAHTNGKNEKGKRFATVIGVAAAGVMALGAQTATAAPDVVKYDTKLTITHERDTDRGALWHGGLRSEARKCVEGRRVFLFRERRGADRKLGSDRNQFRPAEARWFTWGVRAPIRGHVYAKVRPEVGAGFVCRADRSRTIENGDLCFEDPSFCRADRSPTIKRSSHPRSLGAQTALAGGEPVDRTPPDLQLSFSGKETQHVAIGARTDCGQKPPPYVCGGCDHGACAITVKASCGDEACTARGEGTLTKVKNEKLRTASTDLAPGETSGLEMYMTKKTRKKAGKALDEGEKVKAKVTVKATDAAGNVATAKRTIRLGVAHSHYVK
jgi:hypothetical protein